MLNQKNKPLLHEKRKPSVRADEDTHSTVETMADEGYNSAAAEVAIRLHKKASIKMKMLFLVSVYSYLR